MFNLMLDPLFPRIQILKNSSRQFLPPLLGILHKCWFEFFSKWIWIILAKFYLSVPHVVRLRLFIVLANCLQNQEAFLHITWSREAFLEVPGYIIAEIPGSSFQSFYKCFWKFLRVKTLICGWIKYTKWNWNCQISGLFCKINFICQRFSDFIVRIFSGTETLYSKYEEIPQDQKQEFNCLMQTSWADSLTSYGTNI